MSDNKIDPLYEEFKNFVRETNCRYLLAIIFFGVVALLFILDSKDWPDATIKTISKILGLVGALIIGYTTFSSPKNIIELSTTYRAFHREKARDLLNIKLLTAIGTILILLSLIL